MKITKRQLQQIIKEEAADILDVDHPSEVEAIEDVWSGDLEGEARNLSLDIDHPKAAGAEETTKEPEMLPRQESMIGESRKVSLTINQLRKIIKESLLLEEPSDYYRDYRAGTITRQEYEDLVRQYEERESGGYYRRRPAKTSYVGAGANAAKIAAVEDALSKKSSNFLTSILRQLKSGRGLSGKQNSIVKKILSKTDVKAAKLFEGEHDHAAARHKKHPNLSV